MPRASRNIWLRKPYPNKMPPTTPTSTQAPPTLTLPTLTYNPLPYAKLSPLLPNKLSPSSHSTSAPRRSEPLPACPKYFAPRCSRLLPNLPISLSVQLTDFSGSSSTEEGRPRSFASVVFSQRKGRCSTSCFLGEEATDCVSSWILSPSFLCSDRPRFALVSFFNFLHSPLNYDCSSSKIVEKKTKQNNSEKFSRKSVMRFKKRRKKKKQRCMRKKIMEN